MRPNTHFSAFFEIYKIYILLHRSDFKISAKIVTDFRNEFLKNSFNFRKKFGKIVIFLLNLDEFFSEFHVHDEKMLKFVEMQTKFAKFSENSGKIRK